MRQSLRRQAGFSLMFGKCGFYRFLTTGGYTA